MVTVIGQGGPTIILEGPGNTVQTPPLGELSLVVITVDAQEYVLPQLPNIIPEEAMKMWLAAQAELATRSTQVTQVFVKNTNHYNVLDSHTDDVINAITMVLDKARK